MKKIGITSGILNTSIYKSNLPQSNLAAIKKIYPGQGTRIVVYRDNKPIKVFDRNFADIKSIYSPNKMGAWCDETGAEIAKDGNRLFAWSTMMGR